jgi:hypothetical protein
MFIFTIDQEFWPRELTGRIRACDHYLSWKNILKFVYYFIIIFIIVYFFKIIISVI